MALLESALGDNLMTGVQEEGTNGPKDRHGEDLPAQLTQASNGHHATADRFDHKALEANRGGESSFL